MIDRDIRRILVVGDGIVAWCAAAAIRRHLPVIAVDVLAQPVAPDALADRVAATLPSLVGFHEDLRLSERDTLGAAGSSRRAGNLMTDWSGIGERFVHAYGPVGEPVDGSNFHQQWLRSADAAPAAFDSFSENGGAALAGRIPEDSEHGLTLTPGRYRAMIRAFALHLGARERSGAAAATETDAEGRLEAVRTTTGDRLEADLFIDAAGPAGLPGTASAADWEDWSAWLPCDRVAIASAPASDPLPLDRVEGLPWGWGWSSRSPFEQSRGVAWSSRHASDREALAWLGAPDAAVVPLRQGRRRSPWTGNLLAIGDAAVAVEPLEWTNLHLALSLIDRLITMLPGSACAPVEVAEFNRQSAMEAARVRDFLGLHYAVSRRPEPFWRETRERPLPASLQHSLDQFRSRGRLPFYEEETFARDSWLAILIGCGERPRRIDPLATAVPRERALAALRRQHQARLARLPLSAMSPAQ
ncbi:tryptophan 7-halogenase [Sphingomonas ginkgonis]|uniref:Tryptophan 7-halogenase n=1 Tax=Sphingomonas ginkgonis TaxID=2315330 RepID=A0A3R9YLG0_9SPHN|nr:tryptophan 7-halogenase [Sphingomonas ginkgonis]RST30205.1 tryptophan 7-halogenase [Sphingomonas ginkgonis]